MTNTDIDDLKDLIVFSTLNLSIMITLWGLTNYVQRNSITSRCMVGIATYVSMNTIAAFIIELDTSFTNRVKKLN